MMHKLLRVYLSWFGSGYSPKAPGTVGTLASLPFIYAWSLLGVSLWINVLVSLVMTSLAIWAAELIQKSTHTHDPQWIVIDEVIGMFITWTIVTPDTWLEWLLCFSAFRILDIIKIWPASYFDKQIKHGAGTILDDVISGLYAGVFVLLFANFFLRN